MTSKPTPSVVLFVADVPRVGEFYRRLTGMTVLHSDGDHMVLDIDGFQLVVHRLSGEPSVQPDSRGRPSVREDSYLKLCLPVASIAVAREIAASLGGFVNPPEYEWQARGFHACDGHDPEGNVIQVRGSWAER